VSRRGDLVVKKSPGKKFKEGEKKGRTWVYWEEWGGRNGGSNGCGGDISLNGRVTAGQTRCGKYGLGRGTRAQTLQAHLITFRGGETGVLARSSAGGGKRIPN